MVQSKARVVGEIRTEAMAPETIAPVSESKA